MNSNIDSRGIKRGSCTGCADCTEYLRYPNSTTCVCDYCGCFPTKHQKLDETNINQDNFTLQPNEPSENSDLEKVSEELPLEGDNSGAEEETSDEDHTRESNEEIVIDEMVIKNYVLTFRPPPIPMTMRLCILKVHKIFRR